MDDDGVHLIVNEYFVVSVLSLLAGGRGMCIVSVFFRYVLVVKIDVVLAKIAVTF